MSFLGRVASPAFKSQNLAILQLNIEAAKPAKLDILEQIAHNNSATVILLQETRKKAEATEEWSPTGLGAATDVF